MTTMASTAPAKLDLPSNLQSQDVLTGQMCPYCGAWTVCLDSTAVYAKSYGRIYWCQPCNSWVGCHKAKRRGCEALGRLANAELRTWKKAAHRHFDALWKMSNRKNARQNAYQWLSQKMEIPPEVTHIGMFNVDQCKEVLRHCQELAQSLSSNP